MYTCTPASQGGPARLPHKEGGGYWRAAVGGSGDPWVYPGSLILVWGCLLVGLGLVLRVSVLVFIFEIIGFFLIWGGALCGVGHGCRVGFVLASVRRSPLLTTLINIMTTERSFCVCAGRRAPCHHIMDFLATERCTRPRGRPISLCMRRPNMSDEGGICWRFDVTPQL